MQTARSSQPITGSQRCHPTCLKAAKELGGHRHSQDLSGDIPGGSTLLKRWDGTGNRQQPARAGRSRAPLPRRGTSPLNPTPFFFTIRPYRNTFFFKAFFSCCTHSSPAALPASHLPSLRLHRHGPARCPQSPHSPHTQPGRRGSRRGGRARPRATGPGASSPARRESAGPGALGRLWALVLRGERR